MDYSYNEQWELEQEERDEAAREYVAEQIALEKDEDVMRELAWREELIAKEMQAFPQLSRETVARVVDAVHRNPMAVQRFLAARKAAP